MSPPERLGLFISNLIQIHLLPLIMVGQNVQSKHADLRAKYDYEANKKAEKEIETVLLRLEEQNKLILEIVKRIKSLEEKTLYEYKQRNCRSSHA